MSVRILKKTLIIARFLKLNIFERQKGFSFSLPGHLSRRGKNTARRRAKCYGANAQWAKRRSDRVGSKGRLNFVYLLTNRCLQYAQEQQLLKEVTTERDNLLEEVNGAKECAADRKQQAETLKTREAELLASIRSLTENNSSFRQELEAKTDRLKILEKANVEYEELKQIHEKVTASLKELREQYESDKVGSVDELETAKKAAEDANSRVKALEKQNQGKMILFSCSQFL